uniref:KEOPS complex Pcc1-like subunit n=1 Tax=Candidatus Methanomethylicus mesodigestus TaxID=1867258 RepID=A0A7C3EVR3_9CREN
MSVRAILKVDFGDDRLAENIRRALTPEAKSSKSAKSAASIRAEGGSVILEIEAAGVASLRALLNSYIRWMFTSSEIVRLKGD